MFIQTEETAHNDTLRFIPGRDVYGPGAVFTAVDSARSPLAKRLFELNTVLKVTLGADDVLVTKSIEVEWHDLRPRILAALMDHFMSGAAVVDEAAIATVEEVDDELTGPAAEIKEIVETRIRAAAKDGGGDITFRAFKDGIAYLRFEGSAYGLLQPIQNMLKHYVPEVEDVRDAIDLEDRPGLQTEEGKAILQLLEEQINPQVAGHGGHISLIDVKENTVFVRLEGGCQGCSASSATLRQGVEVEIKKLIPSVAQVVDVTDHTAGSNPYYS
ncbi:MAG: Fe/S biogenesis protein NfuA [Alphaproteobacteria bacterium MarineAlpha11_Bin1]|nr:MAG: Fe/S biogenesis protein NfuA [Alphaproteobacteria bacterium MarineAlpha11_Bin1]|tara:strand:- start:13885 stop:14700 length:816 start_codon:yes stop_codon:yes gene_type:complete